MNILILHDSNFGNGKRLGEVLEQVWQQEGHTVQVERVSQIAPEATAKKPPDFLVFGAAIRKFRSSPATKRWIRAFRREAKRGQIPHYSALYLTHGLPYSWAKGWGNRLHRRLRQTGVSEHVYPAWLPGRVTAPAGPLAAGVEEAFRGAAREILRWVAGPDDRK